MVRLVGYFLFLSLTTTILVGSIAYVQAKKTLTESVFERLTAVTLIKEKDLVRWVNEQQQHILLTANLLEAYTPYQELLILEQQNVSPSNLAYQAIRDDLVAFLNAVQTHQPGFQEIFILTSVGGKIIVSTDKTHEGEYRVLDSYFIHGKQEPFIQKVYPSPITGKPTITIATPLVDDTGQLIGVLAVHLNLDEMDSIVLDNIGLGESGEVYMVDAYNVFVSGQRFGREEYPRGIHTPGINAAIQEGVGADLYSNYDNTPVIGAYRWIDELGLALLAEMYQEEAFADARRLASTIALVGGATTILLTGGVYWLARQIARPILAMTETAVLVAEGDLTSMAPVTTEDEIGLLARTFNQMIRQLRILYAGLEEKVAELQQADTALREARDQLEVRVRERTAELTLLNRASQSLISTLEQDQVLNMVLEELRHLLNVVACSVWLVDERKGQLVCRQSSGPQSDRVRGWRLPEGVGIIGWVVENGRSLLLDDAQNDSRHYYGLDHSVALTTRSLLSIPLLAQGRVIGALQALDSEPSRFDESDLALMESLAATAAFAIENARLYSQARQDAETRAVLLSEVNHRVKNNLSAIIGLLYAERRHTDLQNKPIYQSIMQDLISRVQGLEAVHNLLSISEWTPISLTELIEQVVHTALQALPAQKQLIVNIVPSSVRVTPNQANYLALIVNELTTNTLKYTMSQRTLGRLDVTVHVDRKQMITLQFQDDGPGYPADVLRLEAPRYNVGLYLLQNIIAHSLHGNLTLQNSDNQDKTTITGAVATIQFKSQV